MSSQAWIKAAAHSRDQSVTLCQSAKLTIICKNYSRFYKIIKHPNQVPSEIVYLVFYPRICRKLPNLQHIYTKKYRKRVIRQANQYPKDKLSFSTVRCGIETLFWATTQSEKGAYRDICSSNCSSGLSSKSLLPFKVSNACQPSSSKVIWNTPMVHIQ